MTCEELQTLPNIGKILAKMLFDAGIKTPEVLRDLGAKKAFLKIKAQLDDLPDYACINKLYALIGAVEGVRWHDLDEKIKENGRQFYAGL